MNRILRFHAACLVLVLTLAGAGSPASAQEETAPTAEAEAQEPEETPEASGVPSPPRFIADFQRTLSDYAGDIFYWGSSASVTGTLGDNAFLGGQLITIDGGLVGGDLFAFAASVTVDGEVRGDVYAFASDVRLTPDAVVHGNVIAFTGALRIAGTVRGHVLGAGGMTVISGDTGPVDIEAGNLTITETAIIRGDLEYRSNEEAEIAEGADVQGQIRWSDEDDEEDEGDEEPADEGGGFSLWSFAWNLWKYLGALTVGIVLLLVGGRVVRQPAASLASGPATGLGFGFVVAVVFPVACLVGIVLLITLPLALIGLVVFALLLYLARLVAAQYVGAWILSRATGNANPSEYLSLALGLALLMLIGLVPYLGFLLRLIALILGLGGIYLALRHFGFPSAGGRPAAAPARQSSP